MSSHVRYVILLLTTFASLIITSELYKSKSSDFSEYSYLQYEYLDKEDVYDRFSETEFLFDENDLKYFVVYEETGSRGNVKLKLYCSDESVIDGLRKNGHKDSAYKSLIYGSTDITLINNFMAYADNDYIPSQTKVYFYEQFDPNELKVSSDFLVNDIQKVESSVNYNLLINSIWIVNGLITILLVLADTFSYRKTVLVKVINGHYLSELILKRFGLDVIKQTFIAIVLLILSYRFGWCKIIGSDVLAIIVITEIFYYASLLLPIVRINIKKALARDAEASRIQGLCFLIRTVMIIACLLVTTLVLSKIHTLYKIVQKEPIISKYNGYSYVSDEDGEIISDSAPRLLLRLDVSILVSDNRFVDCFVCNKNSQSLIEDFADDFDLSSDGVSVLYPDNLDISELKSNEMFSATVNGLLDQGTIEFYAYKTNKSLEYVDIHQQSEDSMLITDDISVEKKLNPIIIYSSGECTDYGTDYFYKLEDTSGIQECINIYDEYQRAVQKIKVELVVWLIIVVMIWTFEFLITRVILKINYSTKSLELCVEKITGKPLLLRYDSLESNTFFSYAAGMILSILCFHKNSNMTLGVSLGIGFFMLLLELLFIAVDILRWEKMNSIKVLKGGCL
jgi:hypothetical protein